MNDLILQVAKRHDVDPQLLKELIKKEQEKVHLSKRRGIKEVLREIIECHTVENDTERKNT